MRVAEDLTEALRARRRLLHHVVVEVHGLAPEAAEVEDQQRLASPHVEHVAQGHDVAERLRHLRVAELQHAVVHPDARERVPDAARLRELVLVVREAEVVAAAVDLEGRAEVLLGHRGALDVPAGPPRPPRRVPGRVLVRLLTLPERKVALVLLQRALLLRDHLLELRAGQPPVVGEAGDAEVDVAVRRVGHVPLEQLLDELDDLRDRLGRARLEVGPPEAEVARVLEEPLRRPLGQLAARDSLLRGLGVDLVVDVGDVVDERHVVARLAQPVAEPHAEDERPRVADVDALVHGRPADVHADRPRSAEAAQRARACRCRRASPGDRIGGSAHGCALASGERFLAREGREYRGELRSGLGAREREPQ